MSKNMIKQNKNRIINLAINEYEDYLKKLDNNFVNIVFEKFVNYYSIDSGLNPEFAFQLFLANNIYAEFSNRIKNDDVDLEIELISNSKYINIANYVFKKVRPTYIKKIDIEKVLMNVFENYNGEEKISIAIARAVRAEIDNIINEVKRVFNKLNIYEFNSEDVETILENVYNKIDDINDINTLIEQEVQKNKNYYIEENKQITNNQQEETIENSDNNIEQEKQIIKKNIKRKKHKVVNEERIESVRETIEVNNGPIEELFDINSIVAIDNPNSTYTFNIDVLANNFFKTNIPEFSHNSYFDTLAKHFNLIDYTNENDLKSYIYLRYAYYRDMYVADEDIAQILNISFNEVINLRDRALLLLKDVIEKNINIVLNHEIKPKKAKYVRKIS